MSKKIYLFSLVLLAHHFEENGGLINAVLEKYYQSLKS